MARDTRKTPTDDAAAPEAGKVDRPGDATGAEDAKGGARTAEGASAKDASVAAKADAGPSKAGPAGKPGAAVKPVPGSEREAVKPSDAKPATPPEGARAASSPATTDAGKAGDDATLKADPAIDEDRSKPSGASAGVKPSVPPTGARAGSLALETREAKAGDPAGRTTIGTGADAPGPDPRIRRDGPAEAGSAVPRVEPSRPAPAASSTAPSPAEAPRRGPGFLPLVLGGLVAGAIGYAIPTFVAPPEVPVEDTTRIEAVEAELVALREGSDGAAAEIATLGEAGAGLGTDLVDLAARLDALEGRTADVAADAVAVEPSDLEGLRARLTEEAARIGALTERLDAVSDQVGTAAGDAGALTERVAGLEDDAAATAERIEALSVELGGRLDGIEGRLDEVMTRASSVEEEAEATARESARSQIRLALRSGAPYVEPLEVLGPAPQPLVAPSAQGVSTEAALVDAFPPLAREALRGARGAEATGGVGGLFRSAFGARSLAPREGDDADAVLSRAEADARSGDLAGALEEIEALPAAAREVLADWEARARARLDALAAAEDFLKDG